MSERIGNAAARSKAVAAKPRRPMPEPARKAAAPAGSVPAGLGTHVVTATCSNRPQNTGLELGLGLEFGQLLPSVLVSE